MKTTKFVLGLLVGLTGSLFAQQGAVPQGIPPLDHVFVIMMENHGYREILNNPNARFINNYANPDVILVVPTVSFQMTLKATGYALTHQLPGRFPPGTLSENKPRAAWLR